jgi:predicted GNAT family acetyltransferase
VNADHTGVPDSFRGTGAGAALVAAMVADARAEGFRIVALCPFVATQAKRHPDWADAFAD